jgi:enamine deaminase RidA (YjgF/YER057c/UK114 family)
MPKIPLENDLYFWGPQGAKIQHTRFISGQGAQEIHICISPRGPVASIQKQNEEIEAAYRHALSKLDLDKTSEVFRRIFVDSFTPGARLQEISLATSPESSPVAISLVAQPPLPRNHLALWAYHIKDRNPLQKELCKNGILVRRNNLHHLWSTNLLSRKGVGQGPFEQTEEIFASYRDLLRNYNSTLLENAIRTWIFVDDIDWNYSGMVKARCKIFEEEGLTTETNFITSTGIEGRYSNPGNLVGMDAYAIASLDRRQLHFLEAPELLSPTSVYGVTFERGVRVDYQDRSHVLISGTASINSKGEILHIGDIKSQLVRTAKNISGLLQVGGATEADLVQMIVYLRNPEDLPPVQDFIDQRYPKVPNILVEGRVCRPSWLVEIECMAIIPHQDNQLPPF